MKTRIIITTVVMTGIHFALTVSSVVIAFGYGMEAFDNPHYEPSVIERVAYRLSGILMQPGMSLWTTWMSKNMPNIFEWGLCVINSLLWGIVLAFVLNVPALVKGKRSDNNGVHSISENPAEASRNE